MRLRPRNRRALRAKAPRIEISEAEITADLEYPARRRVAADEAAIAQRTAPR